MSGTVQRAAETAVTERFEALLRVSQTLISIRSSEELFSILARELRAVVNFYFMGVGIYDEKAHEVHLTSYGELGVPFQAPRLAPEETFTWWVYQHQQPLIIPSLDAETRFPALAEMLKNRGVRSVCALPLTTVHRRLGGLAVGSIEADAYSSEEVSFLSLVANQVALAVDDALNFEASQHAKEALRASEQSLRLIVDSIPGLVLTTTAEGELEFVNQQYLEYFGKTLDELQGWTPPSIVHPDDLSRVLAGWRRSVESGDPYDSEYRIRRADGVYRWFHVRALPWRDPQGRIVRWYTLRTDIDDRKGVEEALRAAISERTRLSAVRAEIGMALARKDSLSEILRACAEAMVQHLDAAFARIWTLNSDSQELELQASAGMYTRLDGRYSRIPLGELKIGFIAQERKAHLTNDVQNDPRIIDHDWARAERMTSFAGYPLVVEDRIVGVVGMFSRSPLTQSTLDTLAFVADGIAQCVERKRAEDALRASEQSFRLIVDSVPGLVLTMTAEGGLEFVSQQGLDYSGKTLEELKGWTTSDIVHPDDLSRVLATWRGSVEAGHPAGYDSEYRIRRADGVYRWFQVRALPVRDTKGRIIRWYALHTDIDDRKRVEDALRASEQSFRLIVESIPGLVNTTTAAGEIELANQQLLNYVGKTLEELKDWRPLVHPDDRELVTARWSHSVETGHPYDDEHRLRRADGVYRWFHVRGLPLRDTQGRIVRWYVLLTDIEKRKQAEDRLQLLLDVTNQVVSNLQLRDLLRAISASVRRVMQCDLVGVFLPDSEGNRLQTLVLDFPESKGFIREEYCSREGSLGDFVLRTGKPWTGNASDVLQLGLKDEAAIPEGLKTGCFLPLVSRNRVLGLLGLGRREENAFSQVDIGFLAQVANQIAIAVQNALEFGQITEAKERLAEQKLYLEDEIRAEHNFEQIIGNSPRLKAVLESVRVVAPADSTVLIQGETGTGKEMIARAIHNLSPRKGQAFVKVNCAAIPLGLLESDLFGHEKGSFTGAIAQKIGRFELAHKGTLFLDEVGDIPLELQPKLLRVLQEQEFERLGSTRTQRVDVRLLAATNASLTQMVAEKKFRSDLYYRLNVFPIDVPPLRDRREDIPLLVRYFANQYARRMGKQIESIPKEAMDALSHYTWPGNIRELQNLMERAALLSTGPSLRVPLAEILTDSGLSAASGGNTLEQAEREQIVRALRESDWVVGGARGAAARLGLKRTSLAYKMQKLGISRPPQ